MADGTTPRGASGIVEQLLVANVRPSPTQPRRRGRDGADLVESIREHGVLSPIWVRTIRARGEQLSRDVYAVNYEIVFGERRRNASEKAGLKRIPAEIHDDLSDEDVAVLQSIENLGRRDVTPLEEAESYRILRDDFKLGVEAIAARLHRDERAVRRGLRLLTLGEEGRKALEAGLLTVDAALALAAIEELDAQREAVQEALDHGDGEAVGRRYAFALVRQRYTLEMASAPWSRGDAKLVPAAGACTTCPKRTGSQLSLLVELDQEDDRCTDRACWRSKLDAHWERVKAAAAQRGAQVVEGEAARKYYPGGFLVQQGSERLLELDAVCWAAQREQAIARGRELTELREAGRGEEADRKEQEYSKAPKPRWRELLGERLAAHLVVRDSNGGVHELAREEEGLKLLRADGVLPPAPAPREEAEDEDDEADEEGETRPPSPPAPPKKATVEELVDQRALADIIKSAEGREPELSWWRFLTGITIRAADPWDAKAVGERRGMAKLTAITAPEALLNVVNNSTAAACRGLLVELLITGADFEEERSPAAVAARFFGVDRAKIRESIEREQKASAEPTPAEEIREGDLLEGIGTRQNRLRVRSIADGIATCTASDRQLEVIAVDTLRQEYRLIERAPADDVRPPVLKGDPAAPPVPTHPALAVDCDACPSKAGSGCVTSKGLPRSPHVSRENNAQVLARVPDPVQRAALADPSLSRRCVVCGCTELPFAGVWRVDADGTVRCEECDDARPVERAPEKLGGARKRYTCSNCGQEGHNARGCPAKRSKC